MVFDLGGKGEMEEWHSHGSLLVLCDFTMKQGMSMVVGQELGNYIQA